MVSIDMQVLTEYAYIELRLFHLPVSFTKKSYKFFQKIILHLQYNYKNVRMEYKAKCGEIFLFPLRSNHLQPVPL
jgi:hypothetical protein